MSRLTSPRLTSRPKAYRLIVSTKFISDENNGPKIQLACAVFFASWSVKFARKLDESLQKVLDLAIKENLPTYSLSSPTNGPFLCHPEPPCFPTSEATLSLKVYESLFLSFNSFIWWETCLQVGKFQI